MKGGYVEDLMASTLPTSQAPVNTESEWIHRKGKREVRGGGILENNRFQDCWGTAATKMLETLKMLDVTISQACICDDDSWLY